MLQKYSSVFLLLVLLSISVIACTEDTPIPEVEESYFLKVTPDTYLFPASGGELPLEITATHNIATILQGDTLEYNVKSVSYAASISGDGFYLENNTVIVEANSESEREATLVISIDGTELIETIHFIQESGLEEEKAEITSIKVLAIGNSFSHDAIEYNLYELAEANGDNIIIGNMYIGGASLEQHYFNSSNNSSNYQYRKIINGSGSKVTKPNYSLMEAIRDEKWDYITIQQASHFSGLYDTYLPYLDILIKYIKKHATNPNVTFAFHATWAYAKNASHTGYPAYGNNQMTMYNAIIDATRRATEEVGIDVIIPAGTAIQNGRTSVLGDTFCSDGYHLEHSYGRYTAACTWYEKLFEKSVVGNSYYPNTITAFEARIAQNAAHFAIKSPYEITSLEDFTENRVLFPTLKEEDY